jgi:hypothetical protein
MGCEELDYFLLGFVKLHALIKSKERCTKDYPTDVKVRIVYQVGSDSQTTHRMTVYE